jgi:hypothetical protein
MICCPRNTGTISFTLLPVVVFTIRSSSSLLG